ncbi:MAG: hypothetical protein ACJAYE_000331, partial [Candidatus Azotimanducaceae bacterium]
MPLHWQILFSSGLLFFASAGSFRSPYCKEEVDYALRRDKPVLTIYSETVELSPGLNMAFGSRQAILRNGLLPQDYQDQLVRAAQAMIRPADTRKQQVDRNSIAIMRFENLSNDPGNAYLADGIEEKLLPQDLAGLPSVPFSLFSPNLTAQTKKCTQKK